MLHHSCPGTFKHIVGSFFETIGVKSNDVKDVNGLSAHCGEMLACQSECDLPRTNLSKGIPEDSELVPLTTCLFCFSHQLFSCLHISSFHQIENESKNVPICKLWKGWNKSRHPRMLNQRWRGTETGNEGRKRGTRRSSLSVVCLRSVLFRPETFTLVASSS